MLGGSGGRNETNGGATGESGRASGGEQNGAGGTSAGQTGTGGESESGGQAGAGGDAIGGGGAGAAAGAAGEGGAAGAEGGAGTGGTPGNPITYGVNGQSCAKGLSCPGGNSCCRRFAVPAGSFSMGTNTDPEAVSDEKPPHATTLKAFELDEFEVTVGRMRSFVEIYDGTLPKTGAGAHPANSSSGWQIAFAASMPSSRAELEEQLNCDPGSYQAWTTQAGVRENFPINCVSWYVALAFCIWDGGRLPTEAEWEMASAGGSEERLYPWGATTPDLAVHAVANCRGDGTTGCLPADLLAVGSRAQGKGKWNHQDLAGSLWEWTLDHYDPTYYQSVGTCTDCMDLSATTPRAIRGGNFTSTVKTLRATGRASKAPITSDPYTGFRCARSP